MPQGNTKRTVGPIDFEPKRLHFTFPESCPPFWNDNSPNKTYFFNTLGVLSPSFERLFILSVLKYRKPLKGSHLEKPMRAFLGQEAHHDHQITRFNQWVEQHHQYGIETLDASNIKFCKALNKRCSPLFQLAMTMGAEHIIAVLSDFNLSDTFWFENADPQISALWRWHAIEEIEHKSVAFDVYHEVCGSYWIKISAMIVVTSVIFGMWLRVWFAFAKRDKQINKLSFWKETFVFLIGKPGVLRRLFVEILKYFHPSFHPWQQDNRALVESYKVD